MPKTTTLADKTILLEKMERDRQALARVPTRRVPPSSLGAAWAKATALAAGAALPLPSVLRQPLRAMAAVAMRERFAELLRRRNVRRASDRGLASLSGPLSDPLSDPLPNPDFARLAKMIAEVRAAAARGADAADIEVLRVQLDEQVRVLRALRAEQ